MHRILLAVLALAVVANAGYGQTDRRGESICGEPPTENIAVTWVWNDGNRNRWSASGPVQELWTNYTSEEEVLEKVTTRFDIAPEYATTWRDGGGTARTIPDTSGYCRRYEYTGSESGRHYRVYVYRLGTEREGGDYDPRREMPGLGR